MCARHRCRRRATAGRHECAWRVTLHLDRRVRGFINVWVNKMGHYILGPQPLHPASGRRRARGHFDVARHLRSGWHHKGIYAATNADRRPAKNFLAYYIRQAMPELRLGDQRRPPPLF